MYRVQCHDTSRTADRVLGERGRNLIVQVPRKDFPTVEVLVSAHEGPSGAARDYSAGGLRQTMWKWKRGQDLLIRLVSSRQAGQGSK